MAPQATVMFAGGDVNVVAGAGLSVIVLGPVIVLPQASVAVHVSVTVPPHGPGAAVCVDVAVPLIKHVRLEERRVGNELGAGMAPQETEMIAGGDVNVGTAGGLTVIGLGGVIGLAQASVEV